MQTDLCKTDIYKLFNEGAAGLIQRNCKTEDRAPEFQTGVSLF